MTTRSASAVAVLGVLLLVACTGSGDDGAPAPVTATSSGAAPTTMSPAIDVTQTSTPDGEQSGPDVSAVAEPPVETFDPARDSIPDGAGQELGPLDSVEFDADTGEGTVQLGDADVPNLAESFPVPVDLEVQLASETATDAGFSGVVDGSVAEFAVFYLDALPDVGFEIVDEQRFPVSAGDDELSAVVLTFESGQQEGSVAIARAPGGSLVSIIVTIAER